MALASLVLRPILISQAHRFGAIGVTFAMVTALTVLGVLMVVGAVLGQVVAGRRAGPRPPADAVQEHSLPDATGDEPDEWGEGDP